MQSLKFKIVGTHPLKMHNSQLANPLGEATKKLKQVTKKRIKSDDDQIAIMELEFEGGMYWDENIGPYIPALCIKAAIVEGAKKTRKGRDAKESMSILEHKAKLIYSGPRTISGLWKAGFRDVCPVSVGAGKTIMRTRPMFTEWETEFTVVFDETVINGDDVKDWVATAGSRIGLLDHRPEFGKFKSTVVPV